MAVGFASAAYAIVHGFKRADGEVETPHQRARLKKLRFSALAALLGTQGLGAIALLTHSLRVFAVLGWLYCIAIGIIFWVRLPRVMGPRAWTWKKTFGLFGFSIGVATMAWVTWKVFLG
jgi:hypothetical protein